MKRKISLVITVFMAVLLLVPALATGCKPKPSGEIVIGMIAELTGFLSVPGIPAMQAATTAMDVAGYQVDGRPIKFVVEDGATDPSVALDKVRKLVETDKACLIICPLYAASALGIAPYLDEVKVPMICMIEHPLQILDHNWVWLTQGTMSQENYPMGIYAYKDLGYRKISLLYPEVSGGAEFMEGFKKGFTELGGQIVQEQAFPPDAMDFSPFILKIVKDADALMTFPVGAQHFPFYKAVGDLGFKLPILEGPSELAAAKVLEATGNVAVGTKFLAEYHYMVDTPGNKEFVDAYQKRWGDFPTHVAGTTYSTMQIALEALRKTGGDTSPEALAKALDEISFNTVRGPMKSTPDRVWTVSNFAFEVVEANGQPAYKYLETFTVAAKKVGGELELSLVK